MPPRSPQVYTSRRVWFDEMNPTIIVAGFVVLLALLLYYMYKEKEGEPVEPSVIKVRDYEAQRAAEIPSEAPVKPTMEPETHPAEQPQELEPAEAAPIEPEVEPSEAEAGVPRPEPAEAAPEEPMTEALTDDLESLAGVGEKYMALLRAAGVKSIAMLAGEEPDALLESLTETNETEGIVKRLPRPEDVEDWVQKAKQQSA